MNNTVEMSRVELYIIRDALAESDEGDVREALAIVEDLLYDATEELNFDE